MNQIKKIILLTGLMISTNVWANPMDDTNPMDRVCNVYLEESGLGMLSDEQFSFIKVNCERNNILRVVNINEIGVTNTTSGYCRFDRNVNVIKREGLENPYMLTCVLYDNSYRVYMSPKR